MRRRIFLIAAAFLFVAVSPVLAERVNYVIDGDTFILENNQRVRMLGINAPETSHRKYHKKGQAFGLQAKKHLAVMILKKDVTLIAGDEEFDRFGRRLSYVYLPDGTFVNRKMVQDGYAEVFRKFPFAYKEEFLGFEKTAREARLGMWAEKKPNALSGLFNQLAEN